MSSRMRLCALKTLKTLKTVKMLKTVTAVVLSFSMGACGAEIDERDGDASDSATAPGRIQAEDFEAGGEGVGYHDTTAQNLGGKYRTNEGVDIEGAFSVGWTAAGEWMAYALDVESSGVYRFDFRVGTAIANAKFHVEIDGVNKTGPVDVPNLGSWTAFTTVSKSNIALGAGRYRLRIVFDTPGTNIDWIDVVKTADVGGGAGTATDIYRDALMTGWENWSWSSTINFGSSERSVSGKAIKVVASAWGALSLHKTKSLALSGVRMLEFDVFSTHAEQITVIAELGSRVGSAVNVTPTANAWKKVEVDVARFGLDALDRISFKRDGSGGTVTFFYDNVRLTQGRDEPPPNEPPTSPTPPPTPPPATPPPATPPPAPPPVGSGTLAGKKLYVGPNTSYFANEARKLRSEGDAALAGKFDKAANTAAAVWLGGWSNIPNDVSATINGAAAQGAVATFVTYNIPSRDCGSFSSGGVQNPTQYQNWIDSIANAIGNREVILLLEPDALPDECPNLPYGTLNDRASMISYSVSRFKQNPNAYVYLSAAHSSWRPPDDMANRMRLAGIAQSDGFSLNISGYYSTPETITYGKVLASRVGGKHFVIDTSRNGIGGVGDEWCNPRNRAAGHRSSTETGDPMVDAFIWVQIPGWSDGACNGIPAGGWSPVLGREQIRNSPHL